MSKQDVIQSHLEVLMSEHLETDELIVNHDGEIGIAERSARVVARVKTYNHNDPHIEIYSIMVDGVDADPGLYEALNDINRRLSHARAFWVDSKVVVAGELAGAAASRDDIDCLCNEVGSCAVSEGPKLAATFGGEVAFPDQVEGESE